MADINSLTPMYDKVNRRFGKIDVLVVNAGVVSLSPLEAVTEEMFDQVNNINYKGVFFTVQKALPYLNNGASIIITSSTVANKGLAGVSVYSATKAAERSLVRTFAAELVGKGIRVNALSPGSIGTPIFKKAGFAQEQKDAMNNFL